MPRLPDNEREAGRTEALPAKACQVVVIYEDVTAFGRVFALIERLQTRFSPELEFDITLWSFEDLDNPDIARVAALAAVPADIMVVAARELSGLPAGIDRWLKQVEAHKTNHPSLMAPLLVSAADGAGDAPRNGHLERFAQRAGMDCLRVERANSPTAPARRSPARPEAGSATAPKGTEIPRFGAVNAPFSHWGLNE